MNMHDFVAGLPKAELHMHIEGSIEPELFIRLARRNAVTIRWQTEDELRAAYRFEDLQDFLNLYYDGCRVLMTAQDFFDVTRAYLRRAHAERVLHAELFLGPQGHTSRGVPLAAVMEGVLEAMDAAHKDDGLSSGLMAVAQRHRSEDEALQMFDALQPWHARLLGFGLGGAEVGNPPAKFARFFELCRERGFRVVAHAGEEGPAAYVREALAVLQVQRLDHGNACMQEPALVAELAASRVPLTMCPLSNLKLKVIDTMAAHPLKQLLQAGLCVTINSDDPSYFGGYVNANYLACEEALGLGQEALVQLARNSFEAAFMSGAQRRAGMQAIDDWVAQAASAAQTA